MLQLKRYYINKYQKMEETQEEDLSKGLSYYYKPLFKLISDLKPKTLLDVGCGSAAFASLFLGYGVKVAGVEFIDSLAQIAKKRGVSIYKYDLNSDFIIKEKFDIILMSAILEHVWDPSNLVKKLKDNFGRELIIVSPNMSSLPERKQILLNRPLNWMYPHADHIRFMNLKVIRDIAKGNDLDIIDVIGYSIPGQKIIDKLHLELKIGRLFPSLFDILIVRLD